MWILPKNYKLCHFAPDMVESKEDLSLLEKSLESSLMWRSKPSPVQTWLRRWKRESWVRHLFGRTLKPCQDMYFETRLTSSLEAILASRFQQQENDKGTDDPRHLWPHICRIIDEVRPRRCFFENVEGHISLGLREVLADLEARGYSTTWGLFSSVRSRRSSPKEKGVHLGRLHKPETGKDHRGERTKGSLTICHHKSRIGRHQQRETGRACGNADFPSREKSDGSTHRLKRGEDNLSKLSCQHRKYGQPDQDRNNTTGSSHGQLNPDWVEQLMGLPIGWTDSDFLETE